MSRFDFYRPRDPQSDAMGVMVPALVLTALGLLAVYSFGASFIAKQAVWAIAGVAACVLVSRVPRESLERLAVPGLATIGVVLALTLLFAPKIEHTRRWLVIPGVGTLQPSEFAKLFVVLFLAHDFARRRQVKVANAWPIGVICLLIVLAPDLGTSVFVAAIGGAMLLVVGAPVARLFAAGVCALPLVLLVVKPYMIKRLEWFKEPGYQQTQAMIALGKGGVFGTGLGGGYQKLGYLPAGHTDFIFANLGEELGLIGTLAIGILYAVLLVHGVRVALGAEKRKDRFGFFLAVGATLVIVLQALLNIAVATGAAPPKGISLPFLSQGGSNLMVSLLAVGLIVGVARHNRGTA
ncbi:MAG: FtsW/RodA/SpoVE family cell cycle protein [Planctomycetota bacterium]|jgi:cell division protein FtsW